MASITESITTIRTLYWSILGGRDRETSFASEFTLAFFARNHIFGYVTYDLTFDLEDDLES